MDEEEEEEEFITDRNGVTTDWTALGRARFVSRMVHEGGIRGRRMGTWGGGGMTNDLPIILRAGPHKTFPHR